MANLVHSADFLTLPDLVLDSIFFHLESKDILMLRLVCRTINTWVTQNPKLLNQFILEISKEPQLKKLTKPLVSLNNINFRLLPAKFQRKDELLKFFKRFGPFIQILGLDSVNSDNEWDIASSFCRPSPPSWKYENNFVTVEDIRCVQLCSSLHSLRICQLRLETKNEIDNCIQMFRTNNWATLKVFEIQNLYCAERDHFQCFGKILECFPSLESVHLPLTPQCQFDGKNDFILTNYILKAVVNYIECQIKKGNCTLSAVHFGQFAGTYKYTKVMLELVELCYISKAVIIMPISSPWYMYTTLLLRLPEVDARFLKQLENIEIAIEEKDIKRITAVLVQAELNNLKRLVISCHSHLASNTLLHNSIGQNTSFRMPNLQEIYVEIKTCNAEPDRDNILKQFISIMIAKSCPSVQMLSYEKSTLTGILDDLLPAWNICIAFPNLVKIKLNCWGGSAACFLTLWSGLELLEELSLHNCVHLGDDAIVGFGDGENLLRLKYLRRLHIHTCGEITDRSYNLVFRHLKLKYFSHTFENIHHGQLVTKVGLESLTHGEFCKSIETMNIHHFDFEWNKWTNEFGQFLNKFPNLKKKPVKPKKKPFFNSLFRSCIETYDNVGCRWCCPCYCLKLCGLTNCIIGPV